MAKQAIRSDVAKKLSNFVKTAQKDEENVDPKIEEDLPGEEGEAGDEVDAEALDEASEGEEDEDIEKPEPTMEQVTESLDQVNETLTSVVDALEDQKDILEQVVSGETEENFDEFTEDEMADEEAPTPEEFGLDTDNLILSKEEKNRMAKKSLREARKNRMQAKTMSEEWNEPATTKKTFKPEAPAPTITTVKKSEVPDMLKIAELAMELNDGKNLWTVVDKDNKPLYTIACTEKQATEDFAKNVILDMQKLGLMKALKKYNAANVKVAEEVVVEKKDEVQTAEKPVEATDAVESEEVAEELPKTSAADHSRKFGRAFRLALTAMHKNLIDNPLKAAFFEELTACEVPSDTAKNVIEAAFAKGAVDHFETAIAQAEEYLGKSDEAFVEIENTIGEMNTKPVEFDSEEVEEELGSKAKAMRVKAAKNSLPLSTASSADASDRMTQLQGALPQPKLAGISRFFK